MTLTVNDPRWLPPVLKVRNPLDVETPPTYLDADAVLDGRPQQVPVHALKAWPIHFEPVWNGTKRAELRHDDRGYAVGDALWLREYDDDQGYTGRAVLARVTHLVPWEHVDLVVVAAGGTQPDVDMALLSIQVEGRYTA